MGQYLYSLRKKSKNIEIEGTFRRAMSFDYAFKLSYNAQYEAWYRFREENFKRTAADAWALGGGDPVLATCGFEPGDTEADVWLVSQPYWNDTSWTEFGVRLGTARKVGGRWRLAAEDQTMPLEEAMLLARAVQGQNWSIREIGKYLPYEVQPEWYRESQRRLYRLY